MGLFSGMRGNATKANVDALRDEFQPILVEGEEILAAYKLVRDLMVFTNKRLILVDKQGTGVKREYHTVPYSRITQFSKESAGLMDSDAELKIWVSGQSAPISKEFKKDDSVNEIYRILSEAVLN